MAVITIKVKDEAVARTYFAGVAARLRTPNLYQNPFKGSARTYRRGGELLGVVAIEPIYPKVWLASVLFLVLYLVFPQWWLLVVGAFFVLIGVLWLPGFYSLLLRRGLRKAGYAGRVRRLSAEKAWGWLLGAN